MPVSAASDPSTRVSTRTRTARGMQRRDGEHEAERGQRHALQYAERTSFETDDVLLRRGHSS